MQCSEKLLTMIYTLFIGIKIFSLYSIIYTSDLREKSLLLVASFYFDTRPDLPVWVLHEGGCSLVYDMELGVSHEVLHLRSRRVYNDTLNNVLLIVAGITSLVLSVFFCKFTFWSLSRLFCWRTRERSSRHSLQPPLMTHLWAYVTRKSSFN